MITLPPKNGNWPSVPQHPPELSLSANLSEAKQLRSFLPSFKEHSFHLDVRNREGLNTNSTAKRSTT